jgi:hypothetical protein
MSEGRIEGYKSDELVSQIASSGSLVCNIQESDTFDGLDVIVAPRPLTITVRFKRAALPLSASYFLHMVRSAELLSSPVLNGDIERQKGQ